MRVQCQELDPSLIWRLISPVVVGFLSKATGKYGFRLQPEQARQLVRDLSAAALASDVKRKAE